MIKTVSFHAEATGPRLLVLGAIHGKEKCGPIAINRFIAEIEAGKHTLKNGRITFVPVCNPRAYAADERYIDRNLNRNLVPMDKPDSYEARLGNILCPMLADCDVLLDIHSTSAGGPSYVFADPADKKNLAYAESLEQDWIVSNFAGALEAGAEGAKEDPGTWAIGTTEYARAQGAMSVTLECGQHLDPAAPEKAYRAIKRALAHLDMLAEPSQPPSHKVPHVVLDKCWFYKGAGSFMRDWQNLERVAKATPVVKLPDGTVFHAPHDCVMVLPNKSPQIQAGDEWFYLGHEA